jgi:hypothetical protein
VCGVTHKRWFWIGWTTCTALAADDLLASGIAVSKQAALDAARAAAGPEAGEQPANLAKEALRRTHYRQRPAEEPAP